MDRRNFIKGTGAVALSCSSISTALSQAATPIKVGVLHSLSGTMAISETALKDTALMTIEAINAKGGVLGRKLEPVVVDPASNWPPLRRARTPTHHTRQGVRCLWLLDIGVTKICAPGV